MSDKEKDNNQPEEVDILSEAGDANQDNTNDEIEENPADNLQAERDDLYSRLQRLSADYLNFQKRAAREKQDARDFIIGDVVMAFADVLDDLELAINHASENHDESDPLLVGTNMVYKKALEVFRKFNVEQIESLEKPFDASLHEALQMQPTDQAEPMTILYEIRKGYKLKDRTIRPARVIVAAPLPEADENSSDNQDEDNQTEL